MIAEQDQFSPESSDLDSVAYDKHLVCGSGMTDQVKRAISASGYSGVQRSARCGSARRSRSARA